MKFRLDEYVADDFAKLTLYNNSERIRYHLTKDAADAIVEIGVLLEDCRGRLLDDGLVLWLQAEFGWSVSDSEAFIDVAREYGLDSSYSPTQRFDVLRAFRPGTQHVTRTQALALEPATVIQNGGDRRSEQFDYNQTERVTSQGGADPEYLTARIARDRPDILERMQQGK
jgi:hypothetical protein